MAGKGWTGRAVLPLLALLACVPAVGAAPTSPAWPPTAFTYNQPDPPEDETILQGYWTDILELSITALGNGTVWVRERLAPPDPVWADGLLTYDLGFSVSDRPQVARLRILWTLGAHEVVDASPLVQSLHVDPVRNEILFRLDVQAFGGPGSSFTLSSIFLEVWSEKDAAEHAGIEADGPADRLVPTRYPTTFAVVASAARPAPEASSAAALQGTASDPGLQVALGFAAALLLFPPVRRRVGSFLLLCWMQVARIRSDRVLEHETRALLYEIVRSSPGCNEAQVALRAGCGRSTVRHHLRILERARLICGVREGKFRRYLAAGADPADATRKGALANPRVRELVALLRGRDGVSQQELCAATGLSRATIWWRMASLVALGLATRSTRNRRTVYGPTAALESLAGSP